MNFLITKCCFVILQLQGELDSAKTSYVTPAIKWILLIGIVSGVVDCIFMGFKNKDWNKAIWHGLAIVAAVIISGIVITFLIGKINSWTF